MLGTPLACGAWQAQRKKHLNRAATDGRPRNLGAMPEKAL